jgi:hypothetical protein
MGFYKFIFKISRITKNNKIHDKIVKNKKTF